MKLREHALDIFQSALAASDPSEAVRRHIGVIEDFAKYRKIWVVGAGKASALMGAAVESVLGDRIEGGAMRQYGDREEQPQKVILSRQRRGDGDQAEQNSDLLGI